MRLLSLLVALLLLLLLLLLLWLWPRGAADSSGAAPRRTEALGQDERSPAVTTSPVAAASDAAPLSEAVGQLDRFGLIRTPSCWFRCGAPCVPDGQGAPVCPPECEQDEDCGSDALCQVTRPRNPAIREFRCLSTQCQSDADCGPGEACDVLSNWHATIRLCRWAGKRRAGEPCAHDLYDNPAGHCGPGLHCSAGVCGLNRCEVDEDCGMGQRCRLIAGLSYRKCIPYCESDADCPADWACYEDDMPARCVRRDGLGCLVSGCPAGQECKLRFGGGAWNLTECVLPCEADAQCGSGEACMRVVLDHSAYCRLPCETDEDCPEKWACRPLADLQGEEALACLPRRAAHEDAFYESFDHE